VFLEFEQLSNISYWQQIAMRCDSAVASIYDESGLEIENLEVLFTEEGMCNKHFLHGMYFTHACTDLSGTDVMLVFVQVLISSSPTAMDIHMIHLRLEFDNTIFLNITTW